MNHINKSLCVVAIFKNESHILQEWINHYINEGINKFFLIDNESTDDYQNILTPYIKNEIVELIKDSTPPEQNELYNKHFLEKCREYEWVMVCDLDEFVYARNGVKTISDFLKNLNCKIQRIRIPWKIFGSSGLKTQPTSVLHNFLYRQHVNKKTYMPVKTIARGSLIKKLEIHDFQLLSDRIRPTTFPERHGEVYDEIDEDVLAKSFLHLNHYRIQSYEWFVNTKQPRMKPEFADVLVDSIDYFYNNDYNEMFDDELSKKKQFLHEFA